MDADENLIFEPPEAPRSEHVVVWSLCYSSSFQFGSPVARFVTVSNDGRHSPKPTIAVWLSAGRAIWIRRPHPSSIARQRELGDRRDGRTQSSRLPVQ